MNLQNITVITHSCIRITASVPAVTVYFDPYQMPEAPHDADYIFITHEHYDHFSPEDIKKTMTPNTILIIPESIREAVAAAALQVKEVIVVSANTRTSIHGISVEIVPAYNNTAHFHPKTNAWVGYIVTLDQVRYYIAGDTDMNEDNVNISCDVALVPAGGTYTMDAREAADFVNILHPKAAVPTHYGSLVGVKEDGAVFKTYVNKDIHTELKLSF